MLTGTLSPGYITAPILPKVATEANRQLLPQCGNRHPFQIWLHHSQQRRHGKPTTIRGNPRHGEQWHSLNTHAKNCCKSCDQAKSRRVCTWQVNCNTHKGARHSRIPLHALPCTPQAQSSTTLALCISCCPIWYQRNEVLPEHLSLALPDTCPKSRNFHPKHISCHSAKAQHRLLALGPQTHASPAPAQAV